MSDIGSVTSGIIAQPPKTALGRPAKATENTDAVDHGDRTSFDTVALSEGGQKILNLARGNDLADEIRSMPVDENFARNLFKAMQDIFRITRRFSETITAIFRLRR